MPTSFNLYFYVVVEMAACKSESGSGIVQLALAKLSPTAQGLILDIVWNAFVL